MNQPIELTEKEMNVISMVYIRKNMATYFKAAMIVNMKYTSKKGDFNLWWHDYVYRVDRRGSFGFAYLSHIMPYPGKLKSDLKEQLVNDLRPDHLRGFNPEYIYSINDWSKYVAITIYTAMYKLVGKNCDKKILLDIKNATITDIIEMNAMKRAVDKYNELVE